LYLLAVLVLFSASNQAVEAATRSGPAGLFIENVGQFDPPVRFYAPASGLWVTDGGLWLTLSSQEGQGLHLKVTFPGASPDARLEPFTPIEARVNYLKGDQKAANVPLWAGVRYVDLYPGYDLELRPVAGTLDWRLAANRPNVPRPDVRLRLAGVDAATVLDDRLQLATPLGLFSLPVLPTIQPTNHPIIPPPNHPTTQPSIPTAQSASLVYSALLGGDDTDCFLDCVIAVDAGGSAYVAGYTRSVDFPTTAGVFQQRQAGASDAFVLKINLDGDQLAFATLIGGEGADFASGIAVDSAGSAYLAGYTDSEDFPVTANALQTDYHGGYADAFIVKLNAGGAKLDYATYLGGTGNDRGAGIAVDRRGYATIGGETQSADFPVSANAFAASLQPGGDAFVARLAPDGNRLDFSTYLGGSGRDDARSVVINAVGETYIAGRTTSSDFPVTAGAFSAERNGFADTYVAKLNADGSGLIYATYLGGSSNEQANGLAVDDGGNAYVVGATLSDDFPTTPDVFDQVSAGGYDAFVAKLTADGTGLVYATYLGGSGGDRGQAIAVDDQGSAYLTGYTHSADFPTTGRAADIIHAGDLADAFVVKLNPTGSGLSYASFLGGNDTDYGTGIAVDGEGSAYIIGSTRSPEFPTARSTFGNTYMGDWDGFVTKLAIGGEKSTTVISGVVRDQDGFGIPGAIISAGASGSTTSDANGVFALIGLDEGIYTLTPLKAGYSFSPARRTVTVPSSEGIQVFTSVAEGDPPQPFLDLPFDYDYSTSLFVQALRDNSDSGWVTSWFDHAYPDYAKNRTLMLWDGHARTRGGYNFSLGCYESRCYDDHNGIDLAYRRAGHDSGNVEIRAAADGEIVVARSGCQIGDTSCGGGLGNHTVIAHPNGYFTLYAHLSRQMIFRGPVKAGDPIGIMGSTGNSTGPHLHFGLFRDDGNGEWDGEEIDRPVDPFGWRGAEGDPWVLDRGGPVSHYLWQHPLSQMEAFAGQQGVKMQDVTGNLQVDVPPDAISGQVTLELFLGPVAGNPPGTRSVGRAFWLRLLEWLPAATGPRQESISTVSSALDQALSLPITLTAVYSDAEVRHLNVDELTLARWNESSRSWQNLPTSVNTLSRTVTVQTQAIGDFDLQAPLICPADNVEPDDVYFAARSVEVGAEPVQRLFDIADDEDWFYLEVEAGRTYIVQTLDLAQGVDTVVEVFRRDAQTRLAVNDNGRSGLASYLEWKAGQDNFYFIRVSQGGNNAHGCGAAYSLGVTLKPYETFIPVVVK
jgi:murein DD-endopeptidase MepM/ murein hydrolase activator NlpD